ncbi:MAG: hypothetical protein HYS12_23895 [Planctomycetes bacterium]|nr:hypothetical protein [Planctomycetota bacterium]
MSDGNLSPTVRPVLRTMRFIHASVLMGCLIFAGIAIVLRQQQGGPVPEPPMLSFVGLALAGSTGLALLIVPNAVAASWRKKIARGISSLSTMPMPDPASDSGQSIGWWGLYQSRLIITAAPMEGVVFLALHAYLAEGPPWILGVGALFFVGLALLFPTQDRVERWIRTQQELVEQEKRTIL